MPNEQRVAADGVAVERDPLLPPRQKRARRRERVRDQYIHLQINSSAGLLGTSIGESTRKWLRSMRSHPLTHLAKDPRES